MDIEKSIFDQVVTNGVFACLFVWLLFQVMRNNKIREEKYQDTINKLGNALYVLEEIKHDTNELKESIKKGLTNNG